MKTKKLKAFLCVFLVLAIIFTMQQPVSVWAETQVETVAQWDFTADPNPDNNLTDIPATGGTDKGAYLTTSLGKPIDGYTAGNKSIYVNGWDNGGNTKYWEISLSAKGYENLKISFSSFSSGTGPRDFKLQYSTDNSNFYDVQNGEYKNGSSSGAPSKLNLILPSEINANENVKLRFLQTSNISVRAGTDKYSATEQVSSTGTSRLFNILIQGDKTAGNEQPPEEETGSVTSYPESGAVIIAGSSVTLTTVTSGAAIQYTLNDGPVQLLSTTSGAISIDEFSQPNNTAVIKAREVIGPVYGTESTFIYKQAQVAKVSAAPTGKVPAGTQITLSSETQGAAISYTLISKAGQAEENPQPEKVYSGPITLDKEMFPVRLQAVAKLRGYLDSTAVTFDYSLDEGSGTEQVYFGQIHSHTNQSDGSGSLTDAYEYAKNIAKLDFFAVTDHSNYFDSTSSPVEYSSSSSNSKWQQCVAAADAAASDSFVALYGYEMTWTGKVGHINTFNTNGFVSRNNPQYTSSFEGMKNYYKLLKEIPQSISQFNHPGKTFGDFNNFSDYDEAIDKQISLIEVGNGEGAIGSGGYFPSYDYYNKALDKGWHLAPTNNQDNHKGLWGTANTARTAVVTDNFSRAGVYDALKNMHVYATEDSNLRIKYTANNRPMGTILPVDTTQLNINVDLSDFDTSDYIGTVSLITNGGKESNVQTFESNNAVYSVNIDNPSKGYYYIKVVEADGDIAVTAPVWVGNVEKVGISSFTSNVSMPVAGETLELSAEIFNNEAAAVNIDSITYKIGDSVIATGKAGQPLNSLGTLKDTVSYTPAAPGTYTIQVEAAATFNGITKIYTEAINLDVRDASKLINLGVDASHLNEYVAGNYANSMTNFSKLAEDYDVRLVEIREGITSEKLSGLSGLILTPPNRKTNIGALGEYSAEELEAIKAFAAEGKTLIVCGLADYGDGKNPEQYHTSYQQNKILEAIGAKARIVDDEVIDKSNYESQNYRLRFKNYNMNSEYNRGVKPEQEYSFYSGASVYINDADKAVVTTIVASHDTSESLDSDKDGKGGIDNPVKEGSIPALTIETLGSGAKIFVAGTVFMSNFEVQATIDNSSQLNYSNYNICQNIVQAIAPQKITSISQVQSANVGEKFTIEGIATSNSSGYDKETAFFDCIYIQDETAGINLFPVSGDYKAGQKVRVKGTVGGYQGEKQLTVEKIGLIDSTTNPITPLSITTADANEDSNRGRLVRVSGNVKSVGMANGIVESITVNDGSGDVRVFIDGYINPSVKLDFVNAGQKITAVGLCSVDTLGKRIRVRDRREITQAAATTVINILHTNDSHGRVYPDPNNKGMIGIDKIAAIKKATPNALLVDAGDTLHGLPIANTTQGLNIIDLMNLAGYDVMTPGNHDFNYGSSKLKEYAEAGTTRFNIISSNIVNKADGSLWLPSTAIKTVNGIKIGFFGLTTTDTTIMTNPSNVSSLEFEDYLSSARKAIENLKAENVDVIIGLTHISRPDVKELAKHLAGDVDVIIDGHDHLSTKDSESGVLIAGSGQYEENLGSISLILNENKDVIQKDAKLIRKADTESIIPDSDVKARAATMMDLVNTLFSQKIGTSEVLLSSERGSFSGGQITNGVRNSEMPLGNLVADAMRNVLEADLAITNGGGLRADIKIGDITAGTLNSVLPFGNYGVIKEVTPKQLKAILEHGLSDAPVPVGKFPQISGMRIEYNPNAPVGSKVTKIIIGNTILNLNDATTKYKLATNDFMANGGDGYTAIKELKTLIEGDSLDVVLEKYVKSLPGVKITKAYENIQGRILAVKSVVNPPDNPTQNPVTGGSSQSSWTPAPTAPGIEINGASAIIKLNLNKTTGEARFKLTALNARDLIEHAKTLGIGSDVTVEIKGQLEDGTKNVCIVIENGLFKRLSTETDAGLRLDTGFAAIELSSQAIDNIYTASKGQDISFLVEQTATDSLPEEIKDIVGDRPVYDIAIMAGNTRITDFGGEALRISIPYALKQGENPNAVVVFYIDEKGKAVQVTGVYNKATGKVEFITKHLSRYAIGYKYLQFSDIWYSSAKSDIEFVSARGLMTGIGNGEFGTDRAMTRGMLITVLGKLAGAEPVGAANFNDVAPDKYYSPYIAWAAENGIVAGTGGNMFRPDRSVSGDELVVILNNFLKYLKADKEITVFQLLPDYEVDSKERVTRADIAVLLRKIIEMSLE